jgi:phytoene synthase
VSDDDPLQRGTPPGSLRQLAVLYAPAESRPVLQALYAFEAEVGDTVASQSHDVAHTRLQWWRGEVDRLLNGQPQHPVAKALLPLREWARDDLSLLHEPLVAADIDLARLVLQDEREVEAYCFRATGSLQTLAAAACAVGRPLTARERDFARRLGSGVRRTESLRDLRGLLARGSLPLPLDALEKVGVNPDTLRPDAAVSQGLVQVIDAARAGIDAHLAGLGAPLERGERDAQRHGLVLGALHRRLLQRIQHRGELARTRAEVPAWSRPWTAWLAAVRST